MTDAIQDPKWKYMLDQDENGILTVTDLKTAGIVSAMKMNNSEK